MADRYIIMVMSIVLLSIVLFSIGGINFNILYSWHQFQYFVFMTSNALFCIHDIETVDMSTGV